jgi:hypothetical protein
MKIGKVKARFSKTFSKLKSFLFKENEKNATRRQLIIIDIMKNSPSQFIKKSQQKNQFSTMTIIL